MKLTKKLIIGTILLTTLGFFWLREPALSPEAEAWLEAAKKPESDNSIYDSYFEWAGIEAENGADTRAIGKRIVDNFTNNRENPTHIKAYPVLPDSFANAKLKDLLDLPEDQIEELIKNNRIFINRYKNILTSPVTPIGYWSESTYIPNLDNLKLAQKLQWLYWAQQLKKNKDKIKIKSDIELEFLNLKTQVNKIDFLLGKMIFNVLLKEHLHLHQQVEENGIAIYTSYPLLSKEDRSVRMILMNELYSLNSSLVTFKKENSKSTKALDILFKVNFSVNHKQKSFSYISHISESEAEAILKTKHDDLTPSPLPQWSSIYDPLSLILSDMKIPSYRPYMLRLLETNCLIDSFNQTKGKEVSVKNSTLAYCHTYTWKDANYR